MSQPATSAESRALLSYLTGQREHVLGILEGLPADSLRRAVLPSGWSCLGMVGHLALEVERFWFRSVIAGEAVDLPAPIGSGTTAWKVGDDMAADEVLALYRREIELADAVIAATPPDAAPAAWPDELFPAGWRLHDMREIMLHVIAETACHAGHLDAVRELIDGRRWLVLT
jgi:hypothetical protein